MVSVNSPSYPRHIFFRFIQKIGRAKAWAASIDGNVGSGWQHRQFSGCKDVEDWDYTASAIALPAFLAELKKRLTFGDFVKLIRPSIF